MVGGVSRHGSRMILKRRSENTTQFVETITMMRARLTLNRVVVSSELLGSFVKSGQVAFPHTKKWPSATSSDGDHDWGLNRASPFSPDRHFNCQGVLVGKMELLSIGSVLRFVQWRGVMARNVLLPKASEFSHTFLLQE